MKLFKILTIIFCLGILLIPKDNFYAQSQDTCCKAGSKPDDCCNNHNSSSTSSHNEKTRPSCNNDDCCSSCLACYTFIQIHASRNSYPELPYYKTSRNLQFQYSDPYISDSLKEIWQPPKIV